MNRHVVLFLAVGFFVFAVWKSCHTDSDSPLPAAEEQETVTETQEEMGEAQPAPVTADPAAGANPDALAEPSAIVDEDLIQARFAGALTAAGTCLGFNVPSPGDRVAPTLENWVSSVKPELGEVVLQTEDWSTADLTTPGGEKRRLRIEMDYSGEDRIVRRVKYFRVGEDESLEPIPLDDQNSADPSETFLASLESDGQITRRERSERIYFPSGEEIVVTERDGRVYELDMTRGGKTFRCKPDDPSPDACRCL
ncbi:MAG: hypothetical protein KF802_11330 [Bdellovibrionaceae bacterium]|nr:hypothetical protein [Pseudobdellovibrionaceae bacterium]